MKDHETLMKSRDYFLFYTVFFSAAAFLPPFLVTDRSLAYCAVLVIEMFVFTPLFSLVTLQT